MHLPRDEAIAAHVEERAALPAHFDGCGLCGLAAAHPPDVITLAERPHAVAILARYALRRGHVLVLTRRHVERYRALSWAEHRDVQRLTWEAARAIERALSPARVFAAALGAPVPLPMTSSHHHVHVVPIYDRDERARPSAVFTWANGVDRLAPEEATAIARALTARWPKGRPRGETPARPAPRRATRRSPRGRDTADEETGG